MPTAVSYQRFSSKKQASGESLNRQAAAAAKWIADHPQHDLILDQTLTDSARSAYKGMHVEEGELGKFLIAVKDGRIPAGTWLIVESLDRLSRRRVMEATNQLTGLCLAGLTVVTTIDSKIYTADSGMADMIISVAYMAQAYQTSRDKSDRISATKVIRVEQAKGTKQVLHQNCPGWLRVTEAATPSNTLTRRYERSPERMETVKWIYEQALDHGAAWIAARLIRDGVQAFGRSGRWNIRYVRNILASQAPRGHLQAKSGLIEDVFPRVISDDF